MCLSAAIPSRVRRPAFRNPIFDVWLESVSRGVQFGEGYWGPVVSGWGMVPRSRYYPEAIIQPAGHISTPTHTTPHFTPLINAVA